MKKQPIRIEKVEKYRKHIARVEKDKGRKLKPSERLVVIYDGNYLEDDTEQEEEEEEKGLSRKELYLCLYYEGGYTIDYKTRHEYFIESPEEFRKKLIEEQDNNDWYPLLKKTRQVMRYFFKSHYKKMKRAKDDSEYHFFRIIWKRTRKGAYYYYNMIRDEDLQQYEKHGAKCVLGIQKLQQKLYDIVERNEREQEEIKRQEKENQFTRI